MPSEMLRSSVAGHTIRIMKWVFLNHLDAFYAMTLIFVEEPIKVYCTGPIKGE